MGALSASYSCPLAFVSHRWYAGPVVAVRHKFLIWPEKRDFVLAENPLINATMKPERWSNSSPATRTTSASSILLLSLIGRS